MVYPILEDEKYKVKERVIRIAPATRLEGHAQINVFLDDQGEVEMHTHLWVSSRFSVGGAATSSSFIVVWRESSGSKQRRQRAS